MMWNRQNDTTKPKQLEEMHKSIGRLWHIGLGFLMFSLTLYNSDEKIREKVA